MRILFLLIFLLAACGTGTPKESDPVIARVEEKTLRRSEINELDPAGLLTTEQHADIVKNWIDREILMAIAAERGLDRDTEVIREIEEARAQILIGRIGETFRAESSDDTAAREALHKAIADQRAKLRIEAHPWKAR